MKTSEDKRKWAVYATETQIYAVNFQFPLAALIVFSLDRCDPRMVSWRVA